jgi:hypothetical protein
MLDFRSNVALNGQARWPTPVIPATWKVEIRGSWFEAILDWEKKKLERLHLNKEVRYGGKYLQSQLHSKHR